MTQEFVTLPREVVEQVRGALAYVGAGNSSTNPNLAQSTCRQAIWKLDHALRAALEQPQNHVPDAGNMVPAGWKLVPVEPTVEMLRAGCGSESPAMFRESLRRETDGQKTVEMVEKIIQRNLNSYRAMLAAAPQPPALEQQVEREPVAGVVIRDGLPCLLQDRHIKSTDHRVYTHPQPAQKPLTDDQVLKAVRHLYQSDLPVGMGFSDDLDVARAVLEAAPQHPTTEQSSAVEQPQVEQKPVAWIWTEWSSRKLTFDGPPAVPSVRDELTKPVWTPLYTHPQPKREPLSTARIDELIEEGIFGGNPYELVRRLEEERGVFMTRPLTDEQIIRMVNQAGWDAVNLEDGFGERIRRYTEILEATHNIK